MTIQRFSDLPLSDSTLADLAHLGYSTPTPVQAHALPAVLSGSDLQVKAETGSGKTAAFGIGIIEKIDLNNSQPQALIIAPTRELCNQITSAMRTFGRSKANLRVLTLCGGTAKHPQRDSLKQAVHIIVGTPGRLIDHLQSGHLHLDSMQIVVLDEADRMLDMGFAPQIGDIVGHFPDQHQTLLFSATFDQQARELANAITDDPVFIEVEPEQTPENLKQKLCRCTNENRNQTIHNLLIAQQFSACIIFCNTKKVCHQLRIYLRNMGHAALTLHGDLEQNEREDILVQFAHNSATILIATDVAARGLDIEAVPGVINYDVPTDPATYIHRIGRTARAGLSGTAITLCSNQETHRWERILELQETVVDPILSRDAQGKPAIFAPFKTLCILGGRKQKLRPGDLLGALTKDEKLSRDHIGKIDVMQNVSYVAIVNSYAKQALTQLQAGRIKGKKFRVKILN
ncbi:MAG: ATP-dependent RNA helicase DbpA [Oceanospirillaceae bacterium]|nr:ATP-dependent RNA helicase DbpA [Oceanospirillaceae bacterium]